ncbi:hypothetical protein HHK36_017007 [Tetracentron sinense]|uniref:GrpE protein homolog n=1 Tax=Tetracentron sinense TaxID=13715 RepID=A0A834Z3S8_TETSI|nr:hypothetical protein HHK36_017007 [Tetracentron sinense]
MATVLRTPPFLLTPLRLSTTSLETPKCLCFSFKQKCLKPLHINVSRFSDSPRVPKYLPFAAYGETTETNEVEKTETQSNCCFCEVDIVLGFSRKTSWIRSSMVANMWAHSMGLLYCVDAVLIDDGAAMKFDKVCTMLLWDVLVIGENRERSIQIGISRHIKSSLGIHVSFLKKKLRTSFLVCTTLATYSDMGLVELVPEAILDCWPVKRNNHVFMEGDKVPVEDGASDGGIDDSEKKPVSAVMASLQSYKEALASNDKAKVGEIESFLQSVEDEKMHLSNRVATLSEELSSERDRILRISADFDNFRKRAERERLSLVTNVQGEVMENLLPVLDNFERAKSQIKVETEAEEKINNSYQSIYKQFVEIMGSLGVVPVETVGNPFDPLLHEAIMSEDSEEFEEGIIIQEFRKGFQLSERLLRPSMVKVSAGPGPAKPEKVGPSEDAEDASVASEEGSAEVGSA